MKKALLTGAVLMTAVVTQAVQVFHWNTGGLLGGSYTSLFIEDTEGEPVGRTVAVLPYASATFYAADEPAFWALLYDGSDDVFTLQTHFHSNGSGGAGSGILESALFGTGGGNDLLGSSITLDRIVVTVISDRNIHVRGYSVDAPDSGATVAMLALGGLGLAAIKRRVH